MTPLNKKRKYKQLRPNGEPVNSNLPYYNEKSALELLPYLERLEEDSSKKVSFNAAKLSVKASTLYHKINQSWLWLMDHHENRVKWKELRTQFSLCKENLNVVIKARTTGISILNAGILEEDTRASLPDSISNLDTNWRKVLIAYVEDSPNGSPPLELNGINLSMEDLDSMAIWLGGIDEVVATISLTKNKIKIVKNRELALKLKEERE